MEYNQVDSDSKYLNLGCGYRFNSHWTNVDFVATGQNVISYDLSQGIPYPDNTFDFVYHSHVLEHFSKAKAVHFLQECYRVLQPGGVLRVVVPDLEQITRLYLKSLEKAADSAEWAANYEWMVLELLDQLVRNSRGGNMATYLTKNKIDNQDFVMARYGLEASKRREVRHKHPQLRAIFKEIREFGAVLHQLMPKSLNRFYTALSIGYFRQSGEVHQWMYDHYSLSNLLKNCGLDKVVQRTATDSYLKNWSDFDLDTEPDGKIYKPDSLYMEAIKPVHR